MESSRGGLLSTLLMTLPLIVVPAVVLLRQPGMLPGVSQTLLDAGESDELSGDVIEDDIFGPDSERSPSRPRPRRSRSEPSSSDDFDSLFAEVPDDRGPDFDKDAALRDPFDDNTPADSADSDQKPDSAQNVPDSSREVLGSPPGADSAVDHVRIMKQLESEGALRTLWFEPGAAYPVGLAVFFRGQTELVRIRFEAVGRSRDACARDVLQQVQRWRQEQQDTGR